MGIAIEKGFHSLAEVLLQNGVPADGRALLRAAEFRNKDIVELMFQSGAEVSMVDFNYIARIGEPQIIRMFIDRGADLITDFPIAKGLIRQTRLFLGIYKTYIGERPELQLQADMALRHFCEEGNLRGVSLLMWLGANPRARVPREADESEELWSTALEAAASKGQLDVIKRLKPNPEKDDVHSLLHESLHCRNMDLVRYWVSLGADINRVESEGWTAHHLVASSLSWALDPRDRWYFRSETKRFAQEWFSFGAKWIPQGDDIGVIRQALCRLSYMEAYEFIKLLRKKEVMSADSLGEILDAPRLRKHLKPRHAAIAALVPRMQKWIKSETRRRQREQVRQGATRSLGRQPSPPRAAPEPRVM